MSESRQRFTGNVIGTVLLAGIVFVLVWWLPLWLLKLFPHLEITSQDPWLINPEDLTWKRAVINMATKPGFRVIPASLGVMVYLTVKAAVTFIRDETRRLRWQVIGERLNEMRLRQSMEWVMEGNRQTTFSEYARWLGVLR